MDPVRPDPVCAADSSSAEWFAAEVHPHESALKAYLRFSFPGMHEVDDIVHESYIRILARAGRPAVRSTRGFLFTVARRLALDRLRRARRSPIDQVADLTAVRAASHDAVAPRAVLDHEAVRLLAEAIDALPPRCREVVIRRKLRQLPQKEVAAQLGISEKTVEAQLNRGIARCRAFFRRRGLEALFDRGA